MPAKSAETRKLNAIEKALEIMLRFQDVNKASWGIRELSAELNFSPATVQRILASLSLAVPEIRTRDKTHFSYCINVLMDAARAFSRAMGQSVTHHNPIPQQM